MEYPSPTPKPGQRAPGAFGFIRLFGVPVRFHFTFWLVAVWLIWMGYNGAQSIAGSALYVLGLFGSVLLHETGHALTARHYGIGTHEIVMLPLGGLSRLQRQPSPAEEFWVALSGPLVNLVIGGALLAWCYAKLGAPALNHWQNATDANIVPRLAVANLILAFFNLLPAFPMDGGRVVRSLLAARRPLEQATRLTARIGTALAALIALYGLISSSFLLIFVAFFVYAGATQEVMATTAQALIHGARVKEAMVTDFRTLNHGDTIRDAADLLLATSQQDFPVLSGPGVAGLLSRTALLRALAADGPSAFVAGAMDRDFPRVAQDASLEEAALLVGRGCALVVEGETLVGMLTAENLSEFMMLRQINRQGGVRGE
ncbi:MAG: site-2 protease family protein [Acidobacteria bacterium]|nr:site-2 protease family protein [Acidobacteriota bacterium]